MTNILRYQYLFILILVIGGCESKEPAKTPQEESVEVDQSPAARLRVLNTQIEQKPGDYSLFEERALVYYQMDSLTQARADIARAIGLFRNDPELHYLAGFFAMADGDTALAKNEYTAAIGLGSQNPEAWYERGQLYYYDNQPDSALQFYKKAQEMDPEAPIYPFAMGYLEESRDRLNRARNYYEKAIELDPGFDRALLQLYDLFMGPLQNPERADSLLSQLLAYDPGHPLGRFIEGNRFLEKALRITDDESMTEMQENVNAAVGAYTIAINRDPNLVQAHYNRGYCYFLGDQYQLAIKDFETTLQKDPSHAQAAFMLGSIYEYFNDPATALEYYRRAANAQPGFEEARKAATDMETRLQP